MTVVDVRKKAKVVPYKDLSATALSVKLAAEIRIAMFTFIQRRLSKPARRPRLIRWSRLRLIKLPRQAGT